MNKIKIDLLSASTVGFNQSGMKTQIDNIFSSLQNDNFVDVQKYDLWGYRNPHLIHYFGMGEGMIQVLKKAKANGAKIICSPNHWPISSVKDKILMNIDIRGLIVSNRITKKFLIDSADLFIVNSKAEKQKFIKFYKIHPKRIRVIYNSYGGEPLNAGDVFLKKYTVQQPYALMVGQIGSERKNQLRVIDIWDASFPNLYILGGIDKTRYAKQCLDLIKSKPNVFALGFESEFEIVESAYQNCRLFISPGLIETPSLAAFRALLNNVVVCSTNFAGVPKEYFENDAKYFNPYDKEEILKSVREGLQASKPSIDVSKYKGFSNDCINNKYKEIYLEIMS